MGRKGKDGIGSDRIEYDRIGLGSKAAPGKGKERKWKRMGRNGRKGRERREERIGQGRITQYRIL